MSRYTCALKPSNCSISETNLSLIVTARTHRTGLVPLPVDPLVCLIRHTGRLAALFVAAAVSVLGLGVESLVLNLLEHSGAGRSQLSEIVTRVSVSHWMLLDEVGARVARY